MVDVINIEEEQINCFDCGNDTFHLFRELEENNICTIKKVYARCTECNQDLVILVDTKIVDEVDDTD